MWASKQTPKPRNHTPLESKSQAGHSLKLAPSTLCEETHPSYQTPPVHNCKTTNKKYEKKPKIQNTHDSITRVYWLFKLFKAKAVSSKFLEIVSDRDFSLDVFMVFVCHRNCGYISHIRSQYRKRKPQFKIKPWVNLGECRNAKKKKRRRRRRSKTHDGKMKSRNQDQALVWKDGWLASRFQKKQLNFSLVTRQDF